MTNHPGRICTDHLNNLDALRMAFGSKIFFYRKRAADAANQGLKRLFRSTLHRMAAHLAPLLFREQSGNF
jgi:hypothetical protein